MLKSCCALLFLLFPCAAAAQYPGDEYYPYAEREERRELLGEIKSILKMKR